MRTTVKYTTLGVVTFLLLFIISCKEDDKENGINLGLFKVAAIPEKGFNWPYYLNVPNSAENSILLVLPNNTGYPSDDQQDHDLAAKGWAVWGGEELAKELQVPVLVPTFPRPDIWFGECYTHALSRGTIMTTLPDLQRIDLQLISMINDAKERLSSKGISVGDKVFIMGFSASGMFANRFTVLHPDLIKAAAIGSPGGWPVAPVGTWEGKNLRYHVGIYDLQQLINSPFNLDQFKSVPLFFFMGSADTNDSVPYYDSYSSEDRDLVNSLFGTTPIERWPKAKQIYEGIGSTCQFILYKGVGHEISNTMKADIIKFFDDNR